MQRRTTSKKNLTIVKQWRTCESLYGCWIHRNLLSLIEMRRLCFRFWPIAHLMRITPSATTSAASATDVRSPR